MSGTSLDGIDLSYCSFNTHDSDYAMHSSKTYNYPEEWKKRLKNATSSSAQDLALLDAELTFLFATYIADFIKENAIEKVDAIASHGHTIFHQPSKKYTLQIGNGSYLSALTDAKVISDFRSADIALGGQGAPLVPIGDRDLFKSYNNRLNLGGFGNISFQKKGQTMAYDICPVNMALNELAANFNLAYDKGGEIARCGKLIPSLLNELNSIDYYKKSFPKSLGAEWYTEVFRPIVNNFDADDKDKLRTLVEHIAVQLSTEFIDGNILITGGGAHNDFLTERIQDNTRNEIVVPKEEIIDFKEALIFAYLGHLRLLEKNNVLASVTGATRDHCAGNIHIP